MLFPLGKKFCEKYLASSYAELRNGSSNSRNTNRHRHKSSLFHDTNVTAYDQKDKVALFLLFLIT